MIICTHNKDNEIPSPLIPFNSIPGGRGGDPNYDNNYFPPAKKSTRKTNMPDLPKKSVQKTFPHPFTTFPQFFHVAQLAVYGQYFVPKTSSSCLHS